MSLSDHLTFREASEPNIEALPPPAAGRLAAA